MIIHVTKDDIEKGRLVAHEQCGCPIWHAVVRELGIPVDKAEDLVEVEDYEHLRLGGTKFALPPEAVSFQRVLVEFPQATVEEMTFVAPVCEYDDIPEKKDDIETVVEESKPIEKPSLLARIFG